MPPLSAKFPHHIIDMPPSGASLKRSLSTIMEAPPNKVQKTSPLETDEFSRYGLGIGKGSEVRFVIQPAASEETTRYSTRHLRQNEAKTNLPKVLLAFAAGAWGLLLIRLFQNYHSPQNLP